MAEPIRIAIIDDHPLFLAGVARTLSYAEDIELVAVGASADEGLAIARQHAPDIMLIDVSMPGGGLAAAATICQSYASIKVIMLTASEREEDVRAAMSAGVRGYVLKGISGGDLVSTIRAVHLGEAYITPEFAARLLTKLQTAQEEPTTQESAPELSVREDQIVRELIAGLTNKEIAAKLGLSEKTVKNYMTSVLLKLRARNRVEAILAHLSKKGDGA